MWVCCKNGSRTSSYADLPHNMKNNPNLQLKMRFHSYLGHFQSGHGTETALVALVDDLCQEIHRWSSNMLILLDLLVTFDTIDHDIFLDHCSELGLEGTIL